jgi:lysyl-tRNA synthetase class 2
MTLTMAEPVSVQSTLLASMAYDSDNSLLKLEFRHGAIYLYLAVPDAIYSSLLAADSKGAYFNSHIRNCFHYTRVRSPK